MRAVTRQAESILFGFNTARGLRAILAPIALVLWCSAADAQREIRQPDQFYTNGESLNAWTRSAPQRLRSTVWFAKPGEQLAYKQLVAILYDDKPESVYYFNPESGQFVGRLELRTEQFSMLPAEARKERLQDIDESAFSPPGGLPSIGEMFEPHLGGQSGNRGRMMLPPPTAQFPRLQSSTWETSYMAANRSRVKAILEFQGDRGTYRLHDRGGMGRLFDVRYDEAQDGVRVHGRWSLGKSNGHFRFDVPDDNMNVFWGEWGFEPGTVVGAWDGIRKP